MGIRLYLNDALTELLKHKLGLEEIQLKQELLKFVYDLVTGEQKSVLWKYIVRQNQSRSESSQVSNRLASSQPYEVRLQRAIKYASKILKEQGYITKEQLEKVGKKFDVDVWDIINSLGIYEKEAGKFYPVGE